MTWNTPIVYGPPHTGIGQLLGWKAATTPEIMITCCADTHYTVEAQMEAVASALTSEQIITRRVKSPSEITLSNGSRILGRITGRDNQGMKGLHSDIIWWGEDGEPPFFLTESIRCRPVMV